MSYGLENGLSSSGMRGMGPGCQTRLKGWSFRENQYLTHRTIYLNKSIRFTYSKIYHEGHRRRVFL
jgi:hypothetical protein